MTFGSDGIAWERYAYVRDNPVRYTDPSGKDVGCPGGVAGTDCFAGNSGGGGNADDDNSSGGHPQGGHNSGSPNLWTLIGNGYVSGWTNFQTAEIIVTSPYSTFAQRLGASAHIVFWGGAHVALAAGVAVGGAAAVEYVVGGSAAGATVEAACADADCLNEVIGTANLLRRVYQGTGMEVNHLTDQRFSRLLDLTTPRLWPSIALSPQQHQVLTNAWRNAIGYSTSPGLNTDTATIQDLVNAVQTVYVEMPTLFQATMEQLTPYLP